MQYITKLKLASVHQLCDVEDRSTEYMLELMQDLCDVDMDTCISYMNLDDKEHSKLFQEVMMFTETIIRIEEQTKL